LYQTSFGLTESPISESGVWTNGLADGVSWGNCATIPGLAYGVERATASVFDDPTAILKGTWSPNQEAIATAFVNNASPLGENCNGEVELRLLSTITSGVNRGYEVFGSIKQVAGNRYLDIVRWNGALGDFTILDHVTGIGLTHGQVFRATATVSGASVTIQSYINDVLQRTVIDNSPQAILAGNPGIGFFRNNNNSGCGIGSANDQKYGWSAFLARNL
jgi:hypothetical protein